MKKEVMVDMNKVKINLEKIRKNNSRKIKEKARKVVKMKDLKLSVYLQLVGSIVGAIGLFTLVSRHPYNVGIVVVGAVVYFIGDFIKKGEN